MDLDEVRQEIILLGRSPLTEKLYPIPSDLVPLTDVLAIITRFKKDWTEFRHTTNTEESKLIYEIFGERLESTRGKQHDEKSGSVEGEKPK